MMRQTETLSKVLNVREQEKKNAQLAHYESLTFFEKKSVKLHNVLQKKEKAEKKYQQCLKEMTTIDKVKEQIAYIETLNTQIVSLQIKVEKARKNMEIKQNKLTDAHVEVKKFEKIIEIREHEQFQLIQKTEQIMMDEISTQQYLNRKLGE